ncbi:hypothetical protein RLD64_06275 [Streptococcus pneumoniae]|uniref:hypothetical protein n=1 Tax=Streptococcus pneumoniae TaxID=1313 RepID=UPI0010E7E70B|nr:hypothetical protein [Streptococcus pneumoniae]MDS2600201.1 hypothetical protein [Streptococcus pneumoniae]MDS5639357.1 hypothetical protein [Streptococcus pneumoniae]NMH52406.1 hypothetical protein [Streptococcus pneumoniae]VMN97229.1 transposase [Streptococcus pneumoniae]
MEQLHFITKLLDIKDPNIKILDIINMDTHPKFQVEVSHPKEIHLATCSPSIF